MKNIKLGMMLHLGPEDGQDAIAAMAGFTRIVQILEEYGYDEAWVLEHHFSPNSLTPAPLVLMAHFLAKTCKLKLGTAAVLLGFHNPVFVAEQIAVLNALYPGRTAFGFAKGGPFGKQNEVFNPDISGKDRMMEALPGLVDLLTKETASHKGDFYQWEDVNLQPKAPTNLQDLYLATADPLAIEYAANNQMGIMAAQFWDLDKIRYMNNHYQSFGAKPQFMAARGVLIADHADDARNQAWLYIQKVFQQRSQLFGGGTGNRPALTEEQLLSVMLVGTESDVAAQTKQVIAAGVNHIALNPLVTNYSDKTTQLARFKQIFDGLNI